MTEAPHVLVAGAGPVGLIAALTLADAGIAVTVAEKRPALSAASRASTFHPPSLAILDRLGVLEEVHHRGQVADRVQYRTANDGVFAEFAMSALKDDTAFPYRLHLEQAQVTPIILDRLRAHHHARILFDAEVKHVAQHGARVVMRVRHGAGHETLDGAFLIAADGSRSDVREVLGIAFDGEEYPDKILRVMTDDDLDVLLPGIAPVTYLWNSTRSVSFLHMPDCWRIILRVPKEIDDEQALDPAWILPRLREVMPHIDRLPNVLMKDVYGVSKRVAARYHDSRVILAGDSAHVTNTRGGMNMNCGIHDAYAIAGAIARAVNGGDPAIVKAAADERRRVATQMLIPRTDRNVTGGPAWLEQVRAMAASTAKALAYLRTTAMLDMASAA
ncbi:MAG TPA: NAD(P)/FAD-dependent oxidoreductase [Candidatus Eremiobacteraceae bacterium]|jgi:2-polyprenyl-6-methoxyphenol hydroxylase-like FAD-dependent oxidoreductase|nr:NAD(P)/FAD-dependent oxidoreductase [Candidatus Eremiobacteraceae bacterium]